MAEHRDILNKAQKDGVISADQNWTLQSYFDRGGAPVPDNNDLAGELSQPRDAASFQTIEDSEAPRFIRGFHDILITIGLVIALVGLGSLTGFIPVIIGAWILAEILIKRQRLALPAVALTLIYSVVGLIYISVYIEQFLSQSASVELMFMCGLASFSIYLAVFYWRFRVPIALAILVAGAIGFIFAIALLSAGIFTNIENLFENAPFIFNLIGLAAAGCLFTAAMYFDLKDRMRKMRWSDVAFWLHLIVAPFLLYSVVSLLLYQNNGVLWWTEEPSLYDAIIVICCVLVMMFGGLVIDRRAFVTSGLISLIAASIVIFDNSNMSFGNTASTALFFVGLLVLTFGVGWQHLRRLVLKFTPEFIVNRVPPVA